jgi:hypothetical protein
VGRGEIREEYDGQGPAPAHRADEPLDHRFPDHRREIAAFMDTSEGTTKMDLGALDSPDLTVTIDYETAKAILVEVAPRLMRRSWPEDQGAGRHDQLIAISLRPGSARHRGVHQDQGHHR